MRAIHLFQFLLLAVLASACTSAKGSLPERSGPSAKGRVQSELPGYEENLRLSLSPEQDQVVPGQRLVVRFTLRNEGSEDLDPCLAERGAIHFFGLDTSYVEAAELSVVDHPFCKTPLFVANGQSVSWSKEIIVPSLPSSTAKLMASIYLVQARDCDRLGCDGVSLSADASPIKVTEKATSRVEDTRAAAPYVAQARAAFPEAKRRFLAGLAAGSELRVIAGKASGQGVIVVDKIDDGWITGHWFEGMQSADPTEDTYTFSEEQILDWSIVLPNGVTEGNWGPQDLGTRFVLDRWYTGATCEQARSAVGDATWSEARKKCGAVGARACRVVDQAWFPGTCDRDEANKLYRIQGISTYRCCG